MITIQHSLLSFLARKGDSEKFKKDIPYILAPDAIRMYYGNRQYSHFEESRDGSDISWLQFPVDLRTIDKEKASISDKHLVDRIDPCVIGEATHIEEFEKHNKHLPERYYNGVKEHLAQDVIFDDCIREYFDCSRKYEDKFSFNGQEMNGKEMRDKVQEISDYGMYVLAYIVNRQYGVKANQDWYDKNVKEPLDDKYSQELSDNTYKYMNVREDINKWITEGDWSHLNEGPIKLEQCIDMYERALEKMNEVREIKTKY